MSEIEITQADYDRADSVGTLTMERRRIVAEEFARHRHEARAEALEQAVQEVHSAIFDCAMRHSGKASAADYSMDVVRAIRALRSGEREGV